jgi:dienelactone hydrolase
MYSVRDSYHVPHFRSCLFISLYVYFPSKMKTFIFLSLSAIALAQVPALNACSSPPAKGYNEQGQSVFSNIGAPKGPGAQAAPKGDLPGLNNAPKKWDFLCKKVNGSTFPTGPEYPKTGILRLNRGGSGPYKSAPFGRTDPTLPKHTIYAPLTPPPADVKMPVIVFGEGGCIGIGTMFPDFLAEVASHGYLVLANGDPGNVPENQYTGDTGLANAISGAGGARTTAKMLTESVDWVMKGGAAKYGTIDTTKIAAAGQSCGGLEAYSASYHDERIKLTILLNSGLGGSAAASCLYKELKSPVVMFLGGPCDIANNNGIKDYDVLTVPKLKIHIDSGHSGTFGDINGGKYGKAVVSFLQWQFRGDEKEKLKYSDPKSADSFVKAGWYNITSSYFPHYESKSAYFNETTV